jgi:hypothetical protein
MPDQTQPWAERTVEVPKDSGQAIPPQRDGFQRGVASVGRPRAPRTEAFPAVGHEQEPTGWFSPGPSRPLSWYLAQWRNGAEWTAAGGLFAFVCWGIWAISARGDLTSPVVTFLLTLLVAVGLFALSRLLGRLVWERQLGRIRRSARGAHAVTAIFLGGVGIAYLQQTEWVVSVWNWITGG